MENCEILPYNRNKTGGISQKFTRFRSEIRGQKVGVHLNMKRLAFTNPKFYCENLKNVQNASEIILFPTKTSPNPEDFLTFQQKIRFLSSNLTKYLSCPENFLGFLKHLQEILLEKYEFSDFPSINHVLESEIPPVLLNIFTYNYNSSVFFVETAKVFLIFSSGTVEIREKLIKMQIIEVFLDFLDESLENDEFLQISLIILANLSFSKENRQKMFENGIALKILAFSFVKSPKNSSKSLEIFSSTLFLINSLCNPAEFEEIRLFIKPVLNFMEIQEIRKECLEIILQISEFSQQKFVDLLIKDENLVKYLKFYIGFEKNADFLEICLEIITNFTLGSAFHAEFLLDCGVISLMIATFPRNCGGNPQIQRKIIRILSNILQESRKIVQILLENGFFLNVFKLLDVESADLKWEFIDFFIGFSYYAPINCMHFVLTSEILTFLCAEITADCQKLKTIIDFLELLGFLLENHADFPVISPDFAEFYLQQFESHKNHKISNKSVKIREFLIKNSRFQ